MDRCTTALAETRRQVAALLAATPTTNHSPWPPRIGVEAEFLVFDDRGDGRASVPIERVSRILAGRAALADDPAHPSFEPGGQLELSPAPVPTATLAIAGIQGHAARVGTRLARHGIRLEPSGVDRWRSPEEVGLQTPRDRYLVMQRQFDAIGPAGRRMMRQTASLQVCVDRAPGVAGTRQWLAANLAGPALAAAFRTPGDGDNRTAIWLAVDPSRTGLDGSPVDPSRPVEAYLGFALDAEVMALPRQGERTRLPFRARLRDWIAEAGGRPDEAGERPDAADVAHHLSTLFPPVRPRSGYLEVRYLDAQPLDQMGTAVSLVAILLADPVAREAAIEIGGTDPARLREAWRRSATTGLADPALRTQALELLGVAAERIPAIERRWPGWLPVDARPALLAVAGTVGRTLSAPAGRDRAMALAS